MSFYSSFFDYLYAFPAVDIADMIDSDPENSIFLNEYFIPLIPHE